MINPIIVIAMDLWLDDMVSGAYKDQPMAQHWARVAKITEEAGEAISELISWTEQNPRKQESPEAKERMVNELADTALAAIYAIQHFTKDVAETSEILEHAQSKHINRADFKYKALQSRLAGRPPSTR